MNIEVLVNKKHPLSLDYVPNNLYVVDDNLNNFHHYLDPSLKPMLRKELKSDLEKMLDDASKCGFSIVVDSGYRSSSYQEKLLEKLVKEKGELAYLLIARPGCSEHQTGLAVDFAYLYDGVYNDDVKEEDKEAQWLKNNAWKYGFILRYPKGKEHITGYSFEPWHFRYVGSIAEEIYKKNITLEEYYN